MFHAIGQKIKEVASYISRKGGLPKLLSDQALVFKKKCAETYLKMQDLKKTNFELGIFHFRKGNFRDAILRFRLLLFFVPDYSPDIYYYLGRCYGEREQYAQAKQYLSRYLEETTDQSGKFKEGAVFYLAILNGNFKDLDKIPDSILEERFDRVAEKYNTAVEKSSRKSVQDIFWECVYEVTTHLNKFANNSVLDLGCGIGNLGQKCRESKIASIITGVDLSSEMLIFARGRNFIGHQVYDHLVHRSPDEFFSIAVPQYSGMYQIILAFDLLRYYSNMDEFFTKAWAMGANSCLLCFSILVSNSEEREFLSNPERFVYPISLIKERASRHGWKELMLERDLTINSHFKTTIFVFRKSPT